MNTDGFRKRLEVSGIPNSIRDNILDFLESNRHKAYTVREITAMLGINQYIAKSLIAELHKQNQIVQSDKKKGLVYTYTAKMEAPIIGVKDEIKDKPQMS